MHLDKSFSLDKKYRDYARTDPDLEPLRSEGKKERMIDSGPCAEADVSENRREG
jgi:hypothetical protein